MIDYSRLKSSGVKRVMYFDTITSTNLYAKSYINEDDLLILAGYQSEGRGRLSRTWESEKDQNITLSLIKSFNIHYPHLVNFYTSYVVQRTLKEYIQKQIESNADVISLKWPNDIMLNGKKIGGILSELIDINHTPKKFIIGIGINVNQESFPAELSDKAVSLKNYYNINFSVENIIYNLISRFYFNLALLEQQDILMELWRLNCSMIGKNVRFRHTDIMEEIEGIVVDICNDGGIKIKTSENCNSKNISTYYTGEISFIY